MLLFAQDKVGAVTQEVVEEIARRIGVFPLQVERCSANTLLAPAAPGKGALCRSCTKHQLPVDGGDELWERALPEDMGIGHKEVTADGRVSPGGSGMHRGACSLGRRPCR